MAARTRLLQLAVVVVNITIVGLVFTSVWPFPSGDFKVHLPSAHEISWTYSDGIVHVTAPFSIDNGWIYDVNSLTVSYQVTNGSRSELASDSILVGDIPAGRVTASQLDFTFDLVASFNSGIDWMIFHEDMLYFFLEVSCWYTMKLIQFDATYQVSVPWDALIQGFGISNATYSVSPTPPFQLSVDYWLNTSRLLAGLPPAQVTLSLFGDSTLMGQAQSTGVLGGPNTGTVIMSITPVLAASYLVVMDVLVAGFPVHYEHPIQAPSWVIP